jgi:hypothetical protein
MDSGTHPDIGKKKYVDIPLEGATMGSLKTISGGPTVNGYFYFCKYIRAQDAGIREDRNGLIAMSHLVRFFMGDTSWRQRRRLTG